MTLGIIILATLAAGIGSVWVAEWSISVGLRCSDEVVPHRLLSLAAGVLLATAFMHLLPEAFESGAAAHHLFIALLVGLMFFFLLSKAELCRHAQQGCRAQAQQHVHGNHELDRPYANTGYTRGKHHDSRNWSLLTGDSVHCFGDGVLIAAGLMTDVRVGLIAAVSVLAHEVPHHIGDLAILRQSTSSRRAALIKVSLAGSVTALGGIAGYFLLATLHDLLPYLLVVTSSSFVYVALAELFPQLQKRLSGRDVIGQIGWLAIGIVLVALVSNASHPHGA
ncbi:ZIP family metal transporter [Cupriavidus pinatubonensis]|uniref:Zinc transporter ZupT n=1 Tax=Cupriavidus pinatubonensis TaxID=248026 RepID=A0ABN7ZM64_9BURK|nr:ZIP family metal transporter [Cupriavidus pinatubonensis]CAG9186293.1 Zinc transporter ZupT [Cupriavidus pinatubonensis]